MSLLIVKTTNIHLNFYVEKRNQETNCANFEFCISWIYINGKKNIKPMAIKLKRLYCRIIVMKVDGFYYKHWRCSLEKNEQIRNSTL